MFLDIGRAIENFPYSPVISHEVRFVFFFFFFKIDMAFFSKLMYTYICYIGSLTSQASIKFYKVFKACFLGLTYLIRRKLFFESWSFLVEIRIGKVLFLWHAFHLLWQIVRCYGYTFLYFNYNIKVSALREKLGKEGKDSLR